MTTRGGQWVGLVACVTLFGSSGLAGAKATVIDHPLDIKATLSPSQRSELQDDFRQLLLRRSGLLVPGRTGWAMATAALDRHDCDLQDGCLRKLAALGGSDYALYAAVASNAAGTEVTVRGRVVGEAGVVGAAAVRVASRGPTTVPGAARAALGQLLDQLELDRLPSAPTPALPSREAVAAPRDQAPHSGSPPPLAELPAGALRRSRGSPAVRGLAIASATLATASAGIAVGFGISSLGARQTLPADGHLVDGLQARTQQEVNQQATVVVGLGIGAAALAITSAVLFVVSAPSPRPTVTVAPTPTGAALVVSGRF